jgi:hypothetical protein
VECVPHAYNDNECGSMYICDKHFNVDVGVDCTCSGIASQLQNIAAATNLSHPLQLQWSHPQAQGMMTPQGNSPTSCPPPPFLLHHYHIIAPVSRLVPVSHPQQWQWSQWASLCHPLAQGTGSRHVQAAAGQHHYCCCCCCCCWVPASLPPREGARSCQ